MGLITINLTINQPSQPSVIPTAWMRKVEATLARIEESVQKLEDTYMEMTGRISDDVTALKEEIARLTEDVAGLNEQNTARLNGLADRIDATVAGMQAVDPVAPVVPPEPDPAPTEAELL